MLSYGSSPTLKKDAAFLVCSKEGGKILKQKILLHFVLFCFLHTHSPYTSALSFEPLKWVAASLTFPVFFAVA